MRRRWLLLLLACQAFPGCGSSPGTTTGSCTATIGAYCASAAQGTCTWPGPTPAAGECLHTLRNTACGAYEAVLFQGVDTGSVRYYDRATGALVAVVDYSAVFAHRTCEAGPSGGFSEPSCDTSSFTPSCPDGGS